MEKKCIKCGETKVIDDFPLRKQKGRATTHRRDCKSCKRASDRAWIAKNRERRDANSKTYRTENKEKIRECAKKYNAEHIVAIRAKLSSYVNERLKSDSNFRTIFQLRQRTCNFLKATRECPVAEKLLGCDRFFFRAWFAFQMDGTMTFENHGSVWHIDHVNPCASFDISNPDDLRRCSHWTNTRPLDKYINMSRSWKKDEEEIRKHNEVVELFLEWIEEEGIDDKEHFYTLLDD